MGEVARRGCGERRSPAMARCAYDATLLIVVAAAS